MKVLMSVLDVEFKVIQLYDNLMCWLKVLTDLSTEVKKGVIECLRANDDLFTVSPHEMSCIMPNVACHQLNIDLNARYVS